MASSMNGVVNVDHVYVHADGYVLPCMRRPGETGAIDYPAMPSTLPPATLEKFLANFAKYTEFVPEVLALIKLEEARSCCNGTRCLVTLHVSCQACKKHATNNDNIKNKTNTS